MDESLKQALARTLQEVFAGAEELPLKLSANLQVPAPTYREQADSLESLHEEIRFCTLCSLHTGRSQVVFGSGHAQAKILFLGDAPTASDDKAGQPFTGEAGELFHKMVVAMHLKREEIYCTTLLKCKAPADAKIQETEALTCLKHFERQLKLVRPIAIVAMGEVAAQTLARSDTILDRLRGQTYDFQGTKTFVTYSPTELLSAPDKKRAAWADLKLVIDQLKLKK